MPETGIGPKMSRMRMRPILCWILAGGMLVTLSRTQPRQKPKTETKITVAPGALPNERQPGDEFLVDVTNGDIVMASRKPDGTVRKLIVPLSTKVKPDVTATVESLGPYSVRYRYILQNGPGAVQPVMLFAVGMPNPSQITNVQAAPGWQVGGISPGPGAPPPPPGRGPNPPRQNWWPLGSSGLAPGGSVAGFSFDAPALPGLTRTYIQGPYMGTVREAYELSEWVRNQYSRALELQNNSVQPLTIGPRIQIGPQVSAQEIIRGIQGELASALNVPEIAQNNPGLANIVRAFETADKASALSHRPAFARMGATPLERMFFSAIVFDLEYLERTP
jgi:hypothetical protein